MAETLAHVFVRRIRRDDFEWLHVLWRTAEVRRYLFDDVEISVDDASDMFDQGMAHAALWGGGLWAILELSGGPAIGFVGLWRRTHDEPPELIFALTPERWGRGYASEAARRVIHFAFDELRAERLRASTDPPNTASRRLLERLGMRLVSSTDPSARPLLYFELNREEWPR